MSTCTDETGTSVTGGLTEDRRARGLLTLVRGPWTGRAAAEESVGGRAGHWRRTIQPYLISTDVVAIGLASWLTSTVGWPDAAVIVAVSLVVLAGLGAYRSRLNLSLLDDLPAIVVAALVGGVAQLAWRTVQGQEPPAPELLTRIAVVAGLLAISRALSYASVRHARRVGLVQHRTLILGAGDVGQQLARAMADHPEYGLLPVGMLDAEPVNADALPVPLLGTYSDLSRSIRREGVSEVIVAFPTRSSSDQDLSWHDAELVEVVRACDRLGCEIFCVPRFYELHHRSRDMDEVWGIPLVRARRATWRSRAWGVKRAIDVLVAGIALVLLAPLLVVVALAVRLEVGPQVLFRQVRVGLDGHPFTLLKFRSLRLPDGPDVAPVWSINGDARLGPVGRLIRKTSLDELPQLINILRGDMSLVGPRPERPTFVDEFTRAIPRYTARHRAPAGLTGWAQVNGLRGDTSIEERVRFDNYYIQNWSLWFDAKIIARTVSTVLLRRGS